MTSCCVGFNTRTRGRASARQTALRKPTPPREIQAGKRAYNPAKATQLHADGITPPQCIDRGLNGV